MSHKSKSQQLALLPAPEKQFGGSLLKGNPKFQRPLSSKAPLHLVLKTRHAFGVRSMLHPHHARFIRQCVQKQAQRSGLRVYHFVNVGNHLHLVVRIHDRRRYRIFIRSLTGLIARKVLGVERGKAGSASKKTRACFWLKRPFTRIASWGADYNGLGRYLLKNARQVRDGQSGIDQLARLVPGFDVKAMAYRDTA